MSFRSVFLSVLFAFCFIPFLSAQSWETYEATEYNLKFNVPAQWKTTTSVKDGIPFLESTSPDETVYLFIFVYKDKTISTDDLLNNAVNDLGIKLDGEVTKENLNGMDARIASASGKIDGTEVGMFITAATYDENNYVAYIFTGADSVEKNLKVMNDIIDSISPLKK